MSSPVPAKNQIKFDYAECIILSYDEAQTKKFYDLAVKTQYAFNWKQDPEERLDTAAIQKWLEEQIEARVGCQILKDLLFDMPELTTEQMVDMVLHVEEFLGYYDDSDSDTGAENDSNAANISK